MPVTSVSSILAAGQSPFHIEIDGGALDAVAGQSLNAGRIDPLVSSGLMDLDELQRGWPNAAVNHDVHLLAAPAVESVDRQSRPD